MGAGFVVAFWLIVFAAMIWCVGVIPVTLLGYRRDALRYRALVKLAEARQQEEPSNIAAHSGDPEWSILHGWAQIQHIPPARR